MVSLYLVKFSNEGELQGKVPMYILQEMYLVLCEGREMLEEGWTVVGKK
jgi:hypothetical protein